MGPHLRPHDARADAVHRDVFPRDLLGERSREPHHGELGRAVVRYVGVACAARDRRDVDDPPAPALRPHPDDRRLVHQERPPGVHIHDAVPLRRADFGDGVGDDGPGGVDHDIDPAEALERSREHGVDRGLVGDIRLDGDGAASDLGRHGLSRAVAADAGAAVLIVGARRMFQPGKSELHARAREAERDALADAGSTAGDDGDLACQLRHVRPAPSPGAPRAAASYRR